MEAGTIREVTYPATDKSKNATAGSKFVNDCRYAIKRFCLDQNTKLPPNGTFNRIHHRLDPTNKDREIRYGTHF